MTVITELETRCEVSGNLKIGDEFSFADVYWAKVVSIEKAEKNQITLGIKFAGAHGNLRGMSITMPKSVPMMISLIPAVRNEARFGSSHPPSLAQHLREKPYPWSENLPN